MRILGIDYGRSRIGVALSDPTGLFAQSLTVIKRRSDIAAAERILELVKEHEVTLVVVGLPRHMNGSEGELAEACRSFGALLTDKGVHHVSFYDERLTTSFAERTLVMADVSRRKRKDVIDAVAATIMLQGFLDRQKNERARALSLQEEDDSEA